MKFANKFTASSLALLMALLPGQSAIPTDAADTEHTRSASAAAYGDVNGDGFVDSSDSSDILAAYALLSTNKPSGFTEQQEILADVNGDGQVNSSDASDVLCYYSYLSTGGSVDIKSFLRGELKKPYVPELVFDFSLDSIQEYSGSPYTVVNGNVPFFTEFTTEVFEVYSDLDSLGRCGTAFANVCPEIMPTEPRGEIGSVKPTGWHSVRYDGVDGGYLFNRCHLIGWQLAGENANVKNLITGTRYMNVDGMLPFENMIDDYVDETGNHVMYRVTPVFKDEELVARGVLMEAYSVEDEGGGIEFNVFCYNVQPTIVIDYATGDNWREPSYTTPVTAASSAKSTAKSTVATTAVTTAAPVGGIVQDYVLNINTHKFHYPSCSSVDQMSDKNKWYYTGTREEIIEMGYEPCGRCKP